MAVLLREPMLDQARFEPGWSVAVVVDADEERSAVDSLPGQDELRSDEDAAA